MLKKSIITMTKIKTTRQFGIQELKKALLVFSKVRTSIDIDKDFPKLMGSIAHVEMLFKRRLFHLKLKIKLFLV